MSTKRSKGGKDGGEVQIQKSPAEFFAENQSIAGFDNKGKSLYTSIRELMENSLDACESIGVLPEIKVQIQELTQDEFNDLRGISGKAIDVDLFQTKRGGAGGGSGGAASDVKDATKGKRRGSQEAYFRIIVKDNGCGMKHEQIPNLLGRVLSGSKYGVRQTRGKFGLGAKMALIWSKKSTGVPIQVTSAHRPKEHSKIPSHYTTCTLDIDITKNEPKIVEHKKHPNNIKQLVGTELQILIAGNFTTYKARITQYLRELAIVTPYAAISMEYENISEPQRNLKIQYDRRSEQMPAPAREVRHHPSSVNNLVVQQLLERTDETSMSKFLEKELSSISLSVAKRICVECGWDVGINPKKLSDRQITKLVQVLRTVQLFKAPDGSCLSPLGEYNLNLGIRKVLHPEYVATARDRPCAYEGHPFIVEAAVSLGGKDVKEGINVIRFANRIPLLFEAGADVSTKVAQTKIKWSSYKIDHKKDRIGVFVSIVSTKVPFKGTGKEFIASDINEISTSVKRALQSCCQQLRTHLQKRNAIRDQKERKSRLAKYIPDVTRALIGLWGGIRKRRSDGDEGTGSPRKKARTNQSNDRVNTLLKKLEKGTISENSINEGLRRAIDDQNLIQIQEEAKAKTRLQRPSYLIPLVNTNTDERTIQHELFTFYLPNYADFEKRR